MGFVWTLSFIGFKQTAMDNPMIDGRVDAMYRVVKGRISFENVIPTCIEVAGEIEQLTHLRGPQKLDLLQKVLRVALKDSDLAAEKKEDVLLFIDSILPVVMQAAILASKSPIGVHVQRACVSCWTKK